MSELPKIDPLKVAQRELEKLRTAVSEGANRESTLEILAEALRDERDAAIAELESRIQSQEGEPTPVHDITTLSEAV